MGSDHTYLKLDRNGDSMAPRGDTPKTRRKKNRWLDLDDSERATSDASRLRRREAVAYMLLHEAKALEPMRTSLPPSPRTPVADGHFPWACAAGRGGLAKTKPKWPLLP